MLYYRNKCAGRNLKKGIEKILKFQAVKQVMLSIRMATR